MRRQGVSVFTELASRVSGVSVTESQKCGLYLLPPLLCQVPLISCRKHEALVRQKRGDSGGRINLHTRNLLSLVHATRTRAWRYNHSSSPLLLMGRDGNVFTMIPSRGDRHVIDAVGGHGAPVQNDTEEEAIEMPSGQPPSEPPLAGRHSPGHNTGQALQIRSSAFVVSGESYPPPPSALTSSQRATPNHQLTLDAAVAPMIRRPIAPLAGRSERKRALMNASFYSECFLNAIPPVEADSAALDVQAMFDKWWVRTKYAAENPTGKHALGTKTYPRSAKRRRRHRTIVSGEVSHTSDLASRDIGCVSEQSQCSREDDATVVSTATYPSSVTTADSSLVCGPVLQGPILPHARSRLEDTVLSAKSILARDLRTTGGDVTTATFQNALKQLLGAYQERGWDARWCNRGDDCADLESFMPSVLDGTWLTLSKPTFSDCLGRNHKGQYMYTLGRMAFDMFRPTGLRCSVQGIFNIIGPTQSSGKGACEHHRRRPIRFPSSLVRKSGGQPASVRCYEYVAGSLPLVVLSMASSNVLLVSHWSAVSLWPSPSRPIRRGRVRLLRSRGILVNTYSMPLSTVFSQTMGIQFLIPMCPTGSLYGSVAAHSKYKRFTLPMQIGGSNCSIRRPLPVGVSVNWPACWPHGSSWVQPSATNHWKLMAH